jgi:hypothetical protein
LLQSSQKTISSLSDQGHHHDIHELKLIDLLEQQAIDKDRREIEGMKSYLNIGRTEAAGVIEEAGFARAVCRRVAARQRLSMITNRMTSFGGASKRLNEGCWASRGKLSSRAREVGRRRGNRRCQVEYACAYMRARRGQMPSF